MPRRQGIIYLDVEDLRPAKPDRDHGDLDGLKASIYAHGLLQPLIVAPDRKTVIAGRRRLAAVHDLDWEKVACWVRGDGSAADKFRIALTENLQRKSLTDMETVAWIAQYDGLMRQDHGDRPKGGRPAKTGHSVSGSWSLEKTAEALGISKAAAAKAIKLANIVRQHPDLARLTGQGVLREAARREAWAAQEKRAPKRGRNDPSFVLGDARKAIPSLDNRSVQLLLTDPPYGIGYRSTSQDPQISGGIAGDDDKAGELLEQVLRLMTPKLADDAHCYIFTKLGRSYDLLRPVIDSFFSIRSHIVWVKGKSGPGSEWYAPTTEVVVFATRGEHPRKLFGTRLPDNVVRNRLSGSKRIHPTEKPLEVLVPLIGKSTVPGELIADPFAGSGSTLVAAKQTGRQYWGCEIDRKYHDPAIRRLDRTGVVEEHLHDFSFPGACQPAGLIDESLTFEESCLLLHGDGFYQLEPEEFRTLQRLANAAAA